jgi:hypothetical protein
MEFGDPSVIVAEIQADLRAALAALDEIAASLAPEVMPSQAEAPFVPVQQVLWSAA